VTEADDAACIFVLAGTNGAGKSSIGGAMLRACGANYFNPDEATRAILAAHPDVALSAANALAWQEGKRLLERAIDERLTFVFETTLGGKSITALLERAAASGQELRIWYAGLSTPEAHVARVRARVEKGGHDIPEDRIRARYDSGRLNLIQLLARVTELRVFDNSVEADPDTGASPEPRLVLHVRHGKIAACDLAQTPEWAKPIVAAAHHLP
jgi:predicted ABC-type ATPase